MARDIAEVFLSSYTARDIEQMVSMFEPGATYACTALALTGPPMTVGRAVFRSALDAFERIEHDPQRLWVDESGDMAFAEVMFSGRRSGPGPNGDRMTEFCVFETDPSGGLIGLSVWWSDPYWSPPGVAPP